MSRFSAQHWVYMLPLPAGNVVIGPISQRLQSHKGFFIGLNMVM